MFWDVNFNSESIDSLLNKEDVTLKELLDDEDILQDYKYQNKNLTQFLHRTEIIDELVTLITTEPPADIPETLRFKHSNIACEILTNEVPTLIERLVGSRATLEKLYAFLEQDPPLNPLLTSFCSKTFGMLLSKKPDQDWFSYQCVCLQMLEFIKSRPGFLNTIYKHIGIPVIMDLLYQIITSVEGEELRNSLFDWLKEQQMISSLIKMLGNESDSDKHNNIAQFLCEIIATGRNARQTEVQKRGFVDVGTESSDPLMSILEDDATTALLLDLILTNKRESSIVSGILVILKLLENPVGSEVVTDTALQFLADAEKEHHKKVVANIVRQIKPRINELHDLLLNPPPKNDIKTTITVLSPPFGNTRLYIVSLFSVLLETGNPDIIKAVCETSFFDTLLNLFKQYCWNNILHNQVKKCFAYVFNVFETTDDNSRNPSALQTHVLVNCKIATKFIDCWKHNDEIQSGHKGHRLGYMGHLIDMFEMLYTLVLESHQIRALVESNLTESELEYWKEITDSTNGYLTAALKAQKSYLAGIDPNQAYSYDTSVTKDFQDENYAGDYYNELESNMQYVIMGNTVDDLGGEELFEATCISRNANAFDNDMDDDITWSSSDLKNDFDSAFSKSEVFEHGGPDDIFTRKSYKKDDILNTLTPKNDTDWADFDSHFNEFQISDKNDFPALEQKINNQNAKNTSDDAANGNSNGYNGIGGQKTFAEVAAWGSPSDSNAIDIKRWGSVGNDLGDVNTTEQTLAKYNLSNYNGNDEKNQLDSKLNTDVTTNATTESTDTNTTNTTATTITTPVSPTSNDTNSITTTNGPVESETLTNDQTNNSEIGSDNKLDQIQTMDTNAEPQHCENENENENPTQ